MKTKFFALVLVVILLVSIAFVIAKNSNGNSDDDNRNSIKQCVKNCSLIKKQEMKQCISNFTHDYKECKSTYKQCIADARNNSGSRDEFLEARKKCREEYLQCKSETREVKYACQKTAIESFETCKNSCRTINQSTEDEEKYCSLITSDVNSQCNEGEFCKRRSCNSTKGKCEKVPDACIAVEMPVCGCDNITYGNECSLSIAKQSKLHNGECKDNSII